MTAPSHRLPARVRLVEVGPRDGLQNEKAPVPTDVKVALIDALADAGFVAIEATAFVSPKWVPQMADAADVMARIRRKPGVRYPVLTPNLKGFEAALAAGADEVAVFVAATRELLARTSTAPSPRASSARVRCSTRRRRAACGCAATSRSCWAVPTKATSRPSACADVAAALHAMGAYEVSLGDTIGTGTAGRTQALFARVGERMPMAALAGHFHDTYGQALANVYAAMELGVATFDCSVAGPRRLPVREGRHRQRRKRGRAVPPAGPRHRDRRRSDAPAAGRSFHLAIISAARACRASRVRSTRRSPSTDAA